MTDALKKRKELKARKPTFLAQDHHKKSRIPKRWKRPKGLQSKVRLNKRGYRRGVSSGWRSPKAARGLSPEGLTVVRVENLTQLEAIDPKTQGAMISGRVSIRTKKTLYDTAVSKSITVLNRGAATFNERYDAKMAQREERKAQLDKKEKAKAEKQKKDAKAEKEEAAQAAKAEKEAAKAESEKKADEAKAAATTQTPKSEAKAESKADAPQKAEASEKAETKPANAESSKEQNAATPQKEQKAEPSEESKADAPQQAATKDAAASETAAPNKDAEKKEGER